MRVGCFHCRTLLTKSHASVGGSRLTPPERHHEEMFSGLCVLMWNFYFLRFFLGVEQRHEFVETNRYFLWRCIEDICFCCLSAEFHSQFAEYWNCIDLKNISLWGHVLSDGDFLASLSHLSNLDLNLSRQTPCILEHFPGSNIMLTSPGNLK